MRYENYHFRWLFNFIPSHNSTFRSLILFSILMPYRVYDLCGIVTSCRSGVGSSPMTLIFHPQPTLSHGDIGG